MSLWSALGDWIGGNTGILGTVLKTGATVYSANQAQQANRRAAATVAKANQQALERVDEGSQEALARVDEAQRQALLRVDQGNQQALERVDQTRAIALPGVSRLRTVAMQQPDRLTPDQEYQLEEARRQALTGLNASGLRGSGRATTAVLRGVESDFRNRAIAQNRDRTDRAAAALAGPYFGAAGQGANLRSVAAGQGANVITRAGEVQGANVRSTAGQGAGLISGTGETQADRQTANARLTGQTLADVASILTEREKKRESRFGESDDRDETRGPV